MGSAVQECPQLYQPLFMEKVVFVRAAADFSGVRTALKAGHLYLTIFAGGRSDGVLVTDEQIVHGFGRDLGVLEGDHFTWVEKGERSRRLLEQVTVGN
jgi:hypothetical protein